MPLADGQWSLTYAGTDFVFGTPADGLYLAAAPEYGNPEYVVDDTDRPREDGRSFGQDFLSGQTISFDLSCDATAAADPRAEVLARVSAARGAWRADAVRDTPGEMAELRANIGGRSRVAFGRPRRFVPSLELAHDGVAVALADFAAVDDLFYGDEQVTVVGLVPPPGDGLLAPLASPLLTAQASGSQLSAITVGGDAATWPVLRIKGPITNPSVEVTGLWTLTLRTALEFDQSVTIDLRPWRRRVRKSTGASLAGALTRDSARITAAKVPPGAHQVILRGTDPTASSSLRFAWRDAFTSL